MARRFGGSRFQTVGPQTEKARFPNSVRLLSRPTTAALVDADRSWRWCVLAVLKSIKFVKINSPLYCVARAKTGEKLLRDTVSSQQRCHRSLEIHVSVTCTVTTILSVTVAKVPYGT